MKIKTTFKIVLLLFCANTIFAQTITNVSPTRVTTGSTITITGTGFTSGLELGITIANSSNASIIAIKNLNYVSPTAMTVEVSRINTSGNANPRNSHGNDRIRTLSIF